MLNPDESKLKETVALLAKEAKGRKYVLTALINAVQKDLGEDILIYRRTKNTKAPALLYTLKYTINGDQNLRRLHIICYSPNPAGTGRRDLHEIKRVCLDVAHELGHLVLKHQLPRNPASPEIDISKEEQRSEVENNDSFVEDIFASNQSLEQEKAEEAEADLFALLMLQIYGFVVDPTIL